MKSRLRWLLPLLAVLVLALAIGRALQTRRVEQRATPPAASAAAPTLDLAVQDVLVVGRAELARGIDISGSVKAVNSAFVKARVAAELVTMAVREGEGVRAGQVLAQLDTTEFDWRLRQADQQASAARAQLEIAQRQLKNNQALVAQGFISATALETSISAEAGAQATLQAALAAVELARKTRADATVRAPIDGVVSQRLAQPGERVAVDTRLLEIVDLARLELEAAVPPEEITSLRIGADARLAIDGIAAPIAARVVRINPSAQAGSRAVSAYLAVTPHPALRQGLFARGWIEIERRPALLLPVSAVRTDQARPYAIRITRGRTEQVPLTLGARGRSAGVAVVELVQGLAEGDQVLGASAGLVDAGVPVRLASAAAAAPAESAASASR